MIFDFFDSPELLDIQRTGFYRFLKEDIPQLLAKEFPIKVLHGNYSISLCLNEKNIKLIAPEDNPRDCILKMKTYNCKLYAQIKIVCRKSSNFSDDSFWEQEESNADQNKASQKERRNIVYESLPEWVLLGQLPMMTKRGHFIINGSPRVIVHQVVRSPGIYFQKLLKKDDQKRARFYGDIIPLKGVWVRLQMTKKGRVEAKFKKGKKVEVELLQKCLQVIESQTLLESRQRTFMDLNKSSYFVPPCTATSTKHRFVSIHTNYETRACTGKAKPFLGPSYEYSRFFQTLPPIAMNALWGKKMESCDKKQETQSLRESAYEKLLDKKKYRAESKAEHDAFVHTYDKLYRTTQDKELEEWQKKKKNQKFFKDNAPTPKGGVGHKLCENGVFGIKSKHSPLDLQKQDRKKKTDIRSSVPNSLTNLLAKRSFALDAPKGQRGSGLTKFCNASTELSQNSVPLNGFVGSSSFATQNEDSLFTKQNPFISPGALHFLSKNTQGSYVQSTYEPGFSNQSPNKEKSFRLDLSGQKKLLSFFDPHSPYKEFTNFLANPVPQTPKKGWPIKYKANLCMGSQGKFALDALKGQSGHKSKSPHSAKLESFLSKKEKMYGSLFCKKCISSKSKRAFATRKPENAFKRKKCSEALFATFKSSSRYSLGKLGREKINNRFGLVSFSNARLQSDYKSITSALHRNAPLQIEDLMPVPVPLPLRGKGKGKGKGIKGQRAKGKVQNMRSFAKRFVLAHREKPGTRVPCFSGVNVSKKTCTCSCENSLRFVRPRTSANFKRGLRTDRYEDDKVYTTQLTSLDLCYATIWLYRLRKGEESTDDIDHSQNRRVRTSGELLQTQFENGVSRLKNLLSTKLQEWKGDRSASTFSCLFNRSYKQRYNPKIALKSFCKTKCNLSFRLARNTLGFDKAGVTKQSFVTRRGKLVPRFAMHLLAPSCTFTSSKLLTNRRFDARAPKGHGHGHVQVRARQNKAKQSGNLSSVFAKQKSPNKATLCNPFRLQSVALLRNKSLAKKVVRVHKKYQQRDYSQVSIPTIKELFSTKPITGALREFFGSNPLSQYMDQTNPLAEITHKRRLSSLGLGGVSRESAGMAIRGIHPTHYGRICPIETPEGKNAGLVNSLAFYTKVDEAGFLKTPYYRVFKGQIQASLGFSFCSAKEESATGLQIAPSDLQKSSSNVLRTRVSTPSSIPVRVADNFLDVFKKENPYNVQLIAISPIQMISVATSLIPFLEHNDANRALMGSNMQRQAVPLMISERPIVGTGLESTVIVESGHITESQISGFASHVTANRVVIDRLLQKNSSVFDANQLQSFVSLCPYKSSYKYKSTICKKLCTCKGASRGKGLTNLRFDALALAPLQIEDLYGHGQRVTKLCFVKSFGLVRAKHVLQAPYRARACKRGCVGKRGSITNFLGKVQRLTQQKDTRYFSQEKKDSVLHSTVSLLTTFSRSNQNTSITEKPLVREFDWVQRGDILTDCSASKNGELAVGKNVLLAYIPWEGYNFEDAIVISDRLVREHVYTSLHIERYVFQAQDLKEGAEWFTKHLPGVKAFSIQHLEESGLPKIGSFLKEGDIIVGKIRYLAKKPSSPYERLLCDILGEKNFAARNKSLYVPKGVSARVIYHKVISAFENSLENKVRPPEAAKTVHIFLGEKRVIQVGDKISGRHGNKGVISTILPRQDMPYLPDGTPIDLILNPLGVPSRMNVGQVLECLLGLAASYLNSHFKIAAFDEKYGVEASKSIVFLKLYQARLMSGQNWLFQVSFPGKTRLVDGRSGECFDQWITVGKAYILKLIHMVSEKIHARSTGPYALITQQPLRGRSNKGGQRLGEMEVWALEGFGAAYTLQELLTKKSDDFFGRKQIVDSILPNPASIIDRLEPSYRIAKGRDVLGHPEIFKVLLCELQALCLDLGVYIVTPESFQRTFLGVVH